MFGPKIFEAWLAYEVKRKEGVYSFERQITEQTERYWIQCTKLRFMRNHSKKVNGRRRVWQ
jgi:Asp-tRNA(Asn)/Glu-tRNA(Gln) amidotransferase B subunit